MTSYRCNNKINVVFKAVFIIKFASSGFQNKSYVVCIEPVAPQVISFKGDRSLIPLGWSVSYTCTVSGLAVWTLGTAGQYTIDTTEHKLLAA